MANGDYGDCVPFLAASANASDIYLKTSAPSEDESMPVIKVESLGYVDSPLLKKQLTIEGKKAIKVPSEWSKFWTLVARCHIHHYRDWVSSPTVHSLPTIE